MHPALRSFHQREGDRNSLALGRGRLTGQRGLWNRDDHVVIPVLRVTWQIALSVRDGDGDGRTAARIFLNDDADAGDGIDLRLNLSRRRLDYSTYSARW
jgi:hypothetical protein